MMSQFQNGRRGMEVSSLLQARLRLDEVCAFFIRMSSINAFSIFIFQVQPYNIQKALKGN